MKSGSKNEKLNSWIQEVVELCKPDSVYWCDGSKAEYDRLMKLMQGLGMAIPLKKRPNSFLFRTDPSDVARVEDRTYISTTYQEEAGPHEQLGAPGGTQKNHARPVPGLR